MIIAMAGLPGSGKSTLARKLAEKLPAILLNKDDIRASLFSPETIEYSSRQDDFVVDIMTRVADYHIKSDATRSIILDGRTFMKKEQVDALIAYGCHYDWDFRFIYCTCSDEVARTRLERDVATGNHPAADRDFDMYTRLKSQADKLEVPHLNIDTGQPLESCVRQCLDYLSTDPKL